MKRKRSTHALIEISQRQTWLDDVIDSRGRLVATINVMDIAADEMLRESYLADEPLSEIFARDADGYWSIYLSVNWLSPKNVQAALDKLGKLLGRAFALSRTIFLRSSRQGTDAKSARCLKRWHGQSQSVFPIRRPS